MSANSITLIKPNWPAPASIKAFCSTRSGGISQQPFAGLNLALHVNDNKASVEKNRQLLQEVSRHPQAPHWLTQTHSERVIRYDQKTIGADADGVYSYDFQEVCVVMTADCLPVLLCSKKADFVAAVHAGWRGLASGILIRSIKQYAKTEQLMAWIGPAISQKHFEVGQDVFDAFCNANPPFSKFFAVKPTGKYLADLAGIAEAQLTGLGIEVYQSDLCTYTDSEQFFSYRRDGQTGRMATMIWFDGSVKEQTK